MKKVQKWDLATIRYWFEIQNQINEKLKELGNCCDSETWAWDLARDLLAAAPAPEAPLTAPHSGRLAGKLLQERDTTLMDNVCKGVVNLCAKPQEDPN